MLQSVKITSWHKINVELINIFKYNTKTIKKCKLKKIIHNFYLFVEFSKNFIIFKNSFVMERNCHF